MDLETYTAGDVWVSEISFIVTKTKRPIDPTVVVFEYSVGGGTTVSHTYGVGSSITKTSLGYYQVKTDTTGFATTMTGMVTVNFVWASSGDGQAIKQGAIRVKPPFVVPTFH